MTGDTTINPDASCLVMTTEVRSYAQHSDGNCVADLIVVSADLEEYVVPGIRNHEGGRMGHFR